jgi:hypothetical protein
MSGFLAESLIKSLGDAFYALSVTLYLGSIDVHSTDSDKKPP